MKYVYKPRTKLPETEWSASAEEEFDFNIQIFFKLVLLGFVLIPIVIVAVFFAYGVYEWARHQCPGVVWYIVTICR